MAAKVKNQSKDAVAVRNAGNESTPDLTKAPAPTPATAATIEIEPSPRYPS